MVTFVALARTPPSNNPARHPHAPASAGRASQGRGTEGWKMPKVIARVNDERGARVNREIPVPRLVKVGPFACHRRMLPVRGEPGKFEAAFGFQVTHIPTGTFVTDGFPRLMDAVTFCREIMPLADWPKVTEDNLFTMVPYKERGLIQEIRSRLIFGEAANAARG